MERAELRNCLAACVMTDAEGYTSIAEGMDPGRLVEFVNGYFRPLFAAIFSNGGVVLDVKGDGILAVWATETTEIERRARVCRACLQMLEAAQQMNGLPTRIGADFGPVALANVGALARYEYRAIGDTVNTCSRLQELNKKLGTRILVSQQLAEGVRGFLFRDLGTFMLRGKRSQLRVFELVAERATAPRPQLELCREFGIALAAFEGGRLDEAWSRFAELRIRYPRDPACRYFLRRCIDWKKRIELAGAGAYPSPVAYGLN